MSPYTDEQLSRILSAHAAGLLRVRGTHWNGVNTTGCINQFAFNLAGPCKAADADESMSSQFDREYVAAWSPEQLLAAIERWSR